MPRIFPGDFLCPLLSISALLSVSALLFVSVGFERLPIAITSK